MAKLLLKTIPRLPQTDTSDPPHIPNSIYNFPSILITQSSTPEDIEAAYSQMVSLLQHPQPGLYKTELAEYILSISNGSRLSYISLPGILEFLVPTIRNCHSSSVSAIDFQLESFLDANLAQFSKSFNKSPFKEIQMAAISRKFMMTTRYLQLFYTTRRLYLWVISENHYEFELQCITKQLHYIRKTKIPINLARELATEVTAALILLAKNSHDKKLATYLLYFGLKFFKMHRMAFATPQIAHWASLIKTDQLIAPPIDSQLAGPRHISFECFFQTIKLALNITALTTKSQCMAAAALGHFGFAEVRQSKLDLFKNTAFSNILAYEPHDKSNQVFLPTNIIKLSLAIEKYPSILVDYIHILLARCLAVTETTFDANSYAAATRIMVTLIKMIDSNQDIGIPMHYLFVVFQLAVNIIRSPFFTYSEPITNPISFIMVTCVEQLAEVILPFCKHLMFFITRYTPSIASIQFLSIIFKAAKQISQKDTWGEQLALFVDRIVSFILTGLLYPSKLGAKTVGDCFANFVLLMISCSCSYKTIYWAVNSIFALMGDFLGCDNLASMKPVIYLLKFYDTVFHFFVIKEFAILMFPQHFGQCLIQLLAMYKLNSKLAQAVIKVYTRLFDYENTRSNKANGQQRLIFDCLHSHHILVLMDFISKMEIRDSDLGMSVLNLLLACCTPDPVVSFVKRVIPIEKVEEIAKICEDDRGKDAFEIIKEHYEKASGGNDLVECQGHLIGENIDQVFMGIFTSLVTWKD